MRKIIGIFIIFSIGVITYFIITKYYPTHTLVTINNSNPSISQGKEISTHFPLITPLITHPTVSSKDEVSKIIESETNRISKIIDATVDQKEKIRTIFTDMYKAQDTIPPEQAQEYLTKIEDRIKHVLSEEQLAKIGIKNY